MTGDPVDRATMVYGRLTDIEMADKVRMLMRDTLQHEAICCGARDRIMYLSQQLAALRALIDAHNLQDMLMIDISSVEPPPTLP